MSSQAKALDKDNRIFEYKRSGKLARGGNAVLSFVALSIVALLMVYAIYSLTYTYQIYNNSFLDSELLSIKPTYTGDDTDNTITFKELLAINEDTTSWVTIDDTYIDFPIMQGEDDYEYVNKNIYGDFELSGSIFLSSQNSSDYSDPYNLLYGHNIKGGGMFGDIIKYRDESFFNENLNGILYLPKATYSVSIYAYVECSAHEDNIFYASKDISEMEDFQIWLKENAMHYKDIGVTSEDKIIAMTTCENATTDGRCAIVGKLEQIATVEQGVEVTTEEVSGTTTELVEDTNSSTGDTTSGILFFDTTHSYYHLIIVAAFLFSLLVIAMLQHPAYNSISMSEQELANAEKKDAKKRRIVHRFLCDINIVICVACIYYGRTIYEYSSAFASIFTLTFLAIAEHIRRVKSVANKGY